MAKEKKKLNSALKRLEEIVDWFEAQEEVDVEEGLRQMREGAGLIEELKKKLADAENEFEEIKKELIED
ncbi:MAG: exodeoxyribonuclease VII small subunit [Candidatus Liptonbacteria bacterium]